MIKSSTSVTLAILTLAGCGAQDALIGGEQQGVASEANGHTPNDVPGETEDNPLDNVPEETEGNPLNDVPGETEDNPAEPCSDTTAVALPANEVAARLATLIWQGEPDAELEQLAADNALDTLGAVECAARAMLKRGTPEKGVEALLTSWFAPEELELSGEPSELSAALREDTSSFIAHVSKAKHPRLTSVLTNTQVSLNETLADFYDAELASGATTVDIKERPGLLTRGLYTRSLKTPSTRGKYILEFLLCQPIPEPPEDVLAARESLLEMVASGEATMTNAMIALTENATCAGCHSILDRPGFALQDFGPDGKYAPDQAAEGPLDLALYSAPQAPFDANASSLASALLRTPRTAGCAAARAMGHALEDAQFHDGVRVEVPKEPTLESGQDPVLDAPEPIEPLKPEEIDVLRVAQAFTNADYDLQELLVHVGASGTFLNE